MECRASCYAINEAVVPLVTVGVTGSRRIPQPVWHALSAAALAAYTLGSMAIVFRLAGPTAFGVWAVLMALRGMVAFVEAGLALGVARDVALHAEGDAAAPARVAAARLLYALLAAGIILLAAVGAALNVASLGELSAVEADAARIATVLVGLEAAAILGASPLLAVVRGRQRFDILAYGSIANAVGGLVLVASLTWLFGILGAATAMLVTRLILVAGYRLWVAKNAAWAVSSGYRREGVRDVLVFAVPVWGISIGTQVGLRTQVPLVAATLGAVAAGQFSAGQTLATLAAGLLWVVLDTAFPSLAQGSAQDAAERVRKIALIGTVIGALGFGTLALQPAPLLTLWLGEAPVLAQDAARIYAVAWMVNVPAHVLTIGVMARGRHGVVAPVEVAEAIAVFALSLALVGPLGGIGPAVATVVVFGVTAVIVLPTLLLRLLELHPSAFATAVGAGSALGLVGAGLVSGALRIADLPPGVDVAAMALMVGLPVLMLLRHPSARHALGE